MFNEIWSISSSPSEEWSPATTGWVDADILNGSCDVCGSRDFMPYILYNLLHDVHTITLDSWLVYLLTKLYNWWHVDETCFESYNEICKNTVLGPKIRFSAQMSNNAKNAMKPSENTTSTCLEAFKKCFENTVLGSKLRFSAQMSNNAKTTWNTQKTPTKHVLRLFKKFLKIRFSAQ